MRSYCRLICVLAAMFSLSPLAALAANPDGDLRIEINSSPNFIVDSNVESPSTYAPRSAYLGATLYNDGTTDMTNVFVNIGNYASNTPGVYPSRPHLSLVGPLPGSEFALTHEGGSAGNADAVRYIGTIPAGESINVYWLVSYPNLDESGNAVHGPSVKPDDDLWLEYDVWATGKESGSPLTADVTSKVTMRNEISAAANKIWPNGANKVPQEYKDLLGVYVPTWTNVSLGGTPGVSMLTEGYWFDLGNIGDGFDNDGDLVPDHNAWLQPVGDPAIFDSSSFRLIGSYAMVIVSLKGGGEKIYYLEDDLYLENVPENNGAVGFVQYEWMPLLSGASSVVTPYQEVASGFDNEKFNGDFGIHAAVITSGVSEVEMEKTVDKAVASAGDPLWYDVDFTNTGAIAVGNPGQQVPLVVQDEIPAGTYYVAGSAALSNALPSGVSSYTILYSTNSGTSWSESEPVAASNVTDIQWWLSDALPVAAAGTVTFSVNIDNPYTEPSPFILNVAGLSFGNTAPFLEDDAVTLIMGLNDLGDTVFLDDGSGGGISGNGIQDGTESGIQNITVDLYLDVDEDGVLDATDLLLGTTTTDGSGLYAYTNLADGMFLVQVDDQDSDLPYGSAVTRPTIVSVDLDSASTNSLAVSYPDADFGFAPVLSLTKTIIGTTTNREGDVVSYDLTVSNSFAGVGGLEDFSVWATAIDAVNSGSGNKAYLNPSNAFGLPDGVYATGPFDNATETLAVNVYTITNGRGNIVDVQLEVPIQVTGTFGADESLDINLLDNSSVVWTTNYPATSLSNGTIYFDITGVKAWDWTDLAPGNLLTIQFDNHKRGNNTGQLLVDSAAIYVKSDWTSPVNDPSLTLNPVPLTDTYDADKMEYVSADLEPGSVIVTGSAPNSVGTVYWPNIGPIYPGGAETVNASFKMLEPPNNTTTTNTNTVAVSEATYGDGRPANSATASVDNVVLPGGTIGDYVWRDLNSDGVQDGGNETGIEGVSVTLTPPAGVDLGNGDGNPITNVTDATGYYLFEGLPADGNYTVDVITSTLPGGSGTCTYDEDGGTSTPNDSTVVNLNYDATDGSDTHLTADFGYTVASSIDGTVWHDMNRGGESAPDDAEPWLTGVTVYLFTGTTPGTPGQAIATNTTDANGYFIFSGAYSGDYTVQVVTNTGDMIGGTWTNSFDTDGIGSADYVVTNVVSGGHGRADYSYYETGPYDIGDTLFHDWNGNGIEDTNDEGVVDVTVYLYNDSNTNGVIDAGDILAGTDVTDTNGMYLFEGYIPTNYIVSVDLADTNMPSSYVITADPDSPNDGMSSLVITNTHRLDQDFGFAPSLPPGTIGDTVWKDSFGDGLQSFNEPGISNITVTLLTDWNNDGIYLAQTTTVTDANGWYEFASVPNGSYLVRVDANDVDLPVDFYGNDYVPTTATEFSVDIVQGSTYLDADFGFTPLGAIGDTIFWDANRNGQEDVNEIGVTGVTVRLYIDVNGDGYYDGGDSLYDTALTTSNGYLFSGLPADDYVVVVDTNIGPIAGTLLAADPSSDGVYAQDPGAVDADSEYGVSLNLGERFYGADFGYVPDGIIGDTVWLDFDSDGIRDPEENGIPFVTVDLYTNGILAETKETDSDGWYIFSPLADGTYTVVVDTNDPDFPSGLTQTYDADGTLDDTTTNIVLSGGSMITVDGNSFTNELGIDFGYRYAGTNTLSGTIGLDATPYDGLMGTGTSGVSAGESPFVGEAVYLYLWNDDGDNIPEAGEYLPQGSTLTDTNGDYVFTGLPFGDGDDDYLVSYAPSYEELIMTTTNGSTPATIVSNNVDAAGFTASAWQAVPVAPAITNIDFAFRFSSTDDYDYGDLPVAYGTLFQDNGPRHGVPGVPDLYLGSSVDSEDNGVPSVSADGDDLAGSDDEDGVSLLGGWKEGTDGGSVEVTVGAGSGWLVGFVDFNNDGDLTDAGEMIISEAVSAGTFTNNFDVPAGTFTAPTSTVLYARFRLFEDEPFTPELSYLGSAGNGEVEDYAFEFAALGDYVWYDLNADGIQDGGEAPMTNILVYIDENDNNTYDPTEPSDTTDASGLYSIGGLASGTYTVRVDTTTLPPAIVQSYDLDGTNTPHEATAAVAQGEYRTDFDYGYFYGYIDVGVVKTVDDAPSGATNVYTTIGSNLVYTMVVTNYGPQVATGLEWTDNLPTGVTYVTHSTSTGTYDDVSGIWDLGTLGVDMTATMTVTCVANTNMDGQAITNWITLSAIDQIDTNPTNNQDDAVIKATDVLISRFETMNVNGEVVVEWETASEVGTVGFYLLRKTKDGYTTVNADLLPSVPGSPQGSVYSVSDPDAESGKRNVYIVREETFDGTSNRYGPFRVLTPETAGKKGGDKSKKPHSGRGKGRVKALEMQGMSSRSRQSEAKEGRTGRRLALGHEKQANRRGHPHFTDGPVMKISVGEEGVVSVTAAQFAEATGTPTNEVLMAFADEDLVLTCNGTKVPFSINETSLRFYAQKIDSTYTETNVYVLKYGNGQQMATLEGAAPDTGTPVTFVEAAHFEEDIYSVGALITDPDADHWMWAFFVANNPYFGNKTFTVPSPGVAVTGDASLVIRMQGGSNTGVENEHSLTAVVNGTEVGSGSWSGATPFDLTISIPAGILNDGDNELVLVATKAAAAPYSVTYLNEFDFSYPRKLKASGDVAVLKDAVEGPVSLSGFTSIALSVWDIENADSPVALKGVNTVDGTVIFNAESAHDYIIFGQDGLLDSAQLAAMQVGLLKSRTNDIDYILITVPELEQGASQLASYRGGLGLRTTTVMLESIYDEFSHGIATPEAIKTFLSYAHSKWRAKPNYVVLVGDGSYDYKGAMGTGDCIIPPMLVTTPSGLFASDNWFVDFDNDLVPDVALGRLPVMSNEELTNLVSKIIAYEAADAGDWQNRVLLAADNRDSGGNFAGASELVAARMPADYSLSKAYFEEGSLEATRSTILGTLNGGSAFMSYFGHSGLDRMANEGLLKSEDVPSLANGAKLPILTSMSCMMGRFSVPGYDCLAEDLLLKTDGGCIAAWSPSGMSLNILSHQMAEDFYASVFDRGTAVLGDAILEATRTYASRTGIKSPLAVYGLLGDPALRISGRTFSNYSLEATTFERWKQKKLKKSGDGRGPDDDPDGDGLSNIEEYLFGSDPRKAGKSYGLRFGNHPRRDGNSNGLGPRDRPEDGKEKKYDAEISYVRNRLARDMTLVFETSEDLMTWHGNGIHVVETTISDNGDGLTETVTVRLRSPNGRCFIRLRSETK